MHPANDPRSSLIDGYAMGMLRRIPHNSAAIVGIAFALRLIWALIVPMVPVSDQVAYITFASNLAQHGVYGWTPTEPTAYWAVGTSLIYATLFKVFGMATWPIVALNIAMGVALVVATMAVARVLLGDQVASLAGVILALWPSQIMFVTVAASELPFMLVTVAATRAWLQTEWSILKRGITVGLLLGIATLIRPIALLIPVILLVTLAFSHVSTKTLGKHAASIGVAAVMMALCMAPWTARNYSLFGKIVLVSTNGSTNFWMGNNPNTTGGYEKLPASVDGLDEITRERVLGAEAMAYVLQRPDLFALRTITKALKLHMKETIASAWTSDGIKRSALKPWEPALWTIGNGYWFAVVGFAAVGAIMLAVQFSWRIVFFLPITFWAYYTFVHAVTVADDRYHFPSIPFIAILAAVPVTRMLGQKRGQVDLPAEPVKVV